MAIGIIGGAGPGAVIFNGYAGKMNLDLSKEIKSTKKQWKRRNQGHEG